MSAIVASKDEKKEVGDKAKTGKKEEAPKSVLELLEEDDEFEVRKMKLLMLGTKETRNFLHVDCTYCDPKKCYYSYSFCCCVFC